MGVRSRLSALLRGPQAAPPAPDPEMAERLVAMEARAEKLEKRLSMAMGAIQAATTQLMELKDATAAAHNEGRQAMQRATSAQATAEAAADGVTGVEEQVARLIEGLGSGSRPKAKGKTKR